MEIQTISAYRSEEISFISKKSLNIYRNGRLKKILGIKKKSSIWHEFQNLGCGMKILDVSKNTGKLVALLNETIIFLFN